jgi:hypothetical protein
VRHEGKKNASLDSQFVYRSTNKNRKLTQKDGDFVIFTGYRKILKREDDGFFPGFRADGWFKSTGTQTGDVLKDGVAYQFVDSIDDANPMIFKRCTFPVKGTRIISFTNQPTWNLNYGITDNCDDQATLTINGITTAVTLPLDPWE